MNIVRVLPNGVENSKSDIGISGFGRQIGDRIRLALPGSIGPIYRREVGRSDCVVGFLAR